MKKFLLMIILVSTHIFASNASSQAQTEAKALNEIIMANGGYIRVDKYSSLISAYANQNILAIRVEAKKNLFIQDLASMKNISISKVKTMLSNKNVLEALSKNGKQFSLQTICPKYQQQLKIGVRIKYFTMFDDGSIFSEYMIDKDDCK